MKDLKSIINKDNSDIQKRLEHLLKNNKNDISDFFLAYLIQSTRLSHILSQSDQIIIQELFSIKLAKLVADPKENATMFEPPHIEYPPKTLVTFVLLNLKYMRSLLNYYISKELPQDEASILSAAANKLLDQDLLILSRLYGEPESR